MEFLTEISLFFLKSLIVSLGILAVVLVPLAFSFAHRKKPKKKLEIEDLKTRFQDFVEEFQSVRLDKKALKERRKRLKKDKKKAAAHKEDRPSAFVLSFKGDKTASQIEELRDEISLVLELAGPKDEAIVLIESPGGAVSSYGLAASQLLRLREKMRLAVCVDKVAASGGYLAAAAAHQIIAAPFAFIGSIGVVFQLPNFHEFLKKKDIAFEELTAGKFKRTLTPFGQVTEEKRQKLQEQIDLIHLQFKNFLGRYRKGLDFERAASGEAWTAEEALKLKLVDRIQCSDDYIMEALKTRNVYKIKLESSQNLLDKITEKIRFSLRSSKKDLFLDEPYFAPAPALRGGGD